MHTYEKQKMGEKINKGTGGRKTASRTPEPDAVSNRGPGAEGDPRRETLKKTNN